ncbi:phosphotransferase family protein [Streptomyces sp. NPDC057877]|uniref:phosphotransferase family protein n=1 Tax=Streptomyces sp. NPDC057877 TaxID=3346269 RepID=UPI0036AE1E2C
MTVDSWERARSVLGAAGIPPERLTGLRPLTGGTYNAVAELSLTGGDRYVLKVPPAADVPGLRYEAGLLVGEAEFYRGAAAADVAAPRVVSLSGPDAPVPYLLMTACPGAGWDDAALDAAEQGALRAELGRAVARLHRITGPGFGYPSGALGPLAADWATAFTGMFDAVLADARHYGARLPRPVDEIAAVVRGARAALGEVTVPCLVHFDLWPGNILVDRASGPPRVGGLIDGERMFWGDPLADFVSLALLGDIRKDEAFLAGYRQAGGRAEFDGPASLRLALYRAYLYVIMLTETVPRAVGEENARWVRQTVAPELVAALTEIEDLAA